MNPKTNKFENLCADVGLEEKLREQLDAIVDAINNPPDEFISRPLPVLPSDSLERLRSGIVRVLKSNGVSGKISAGHLRAMGIEIDEKIPDCAEVSSDAIDFNVQYDDSNQDAGVVSVEIKVALKEAFKWVEFKFPMNVEE